MATTVVAVTQDIITHSKVVDAVTAMATDLTALQTGSTVTAAPVLAGALLTLTVATHNRKTILLSDATASVVTLPAATGTGARFKFVVSTVGSGSHIVKVANGTDVMIGGMMMENVAGAAATGFYAGATGDTITLNATTTGGLTKGDWFVVEDIAAGFFAVHGHLSQSGSVATPFSATV